MKRTGAWARSEFGRDVSLAVGGIEVSKCERKDRPATRWRGV